MTDQELREAEERWRFALEGCGDGVWDWNAATNQVFFSRQWKEMLGFADCEISDELAEWETRVHPADLPCVKEKLRQFFVGETAQYVSEHRLRCKDGRYKWILDRGRIVSRMEDGSPLRIVGTHTDIDELWRIKQALRESEERFRNQFMKSRAVELIVNPRTGVIVEANEAAAFFYGYSVEQLKGLELEKVAVRTRDEIFHCLAEAENEVRNVFRTGHCLANGEIKQVEVFATPVIFESMNLLHQVVHDVTKELEMEEAVRQREINLSTFFNTIEDYLMVLDRQGIILKVNDTVTARLGYMEEEILGENVLQLHPLSYWDEGVKAISDILAGRKEGCVLPLQTKMGIQIPVETRVVQGMWDGKPALFVVSKDISAIRMSEEKFSKFFHSSAVLMTISTYENNRFLDVNNAFLQTLGFSRGEVIGKRTEDLGLFFHPDQQDAIRQVIWEKGSLRNYEVALRCKNGEIIYGLLSADIIKVAGASYLISSINDISELRRTEDALKRQEVFQETLLANLTAGVLIVDAENHRIENVNAAAISMFGAPAEAIVGRICQQYLCPAAEGQCPVSDLKQELNNSEKELLKADGTRIPILKSVKKLVIGEEEKFLEVFVDISERKKAEQVLKESEERYRMLMMHSYDAIALIDLMTEQIVEVNPKFTELFGYTTGQQEALLVEDVFPESVGRSDGQGKAWLHDDSEGHCDILTVTVRNGSQRMVERAGNIITMGERAYKLAMFRDVTEEKKRQKEVQNDLIFASQVQRALLSPAPQTEYFRVQTLFRPCGFVSGDLYYLEWIEDQLLLRGYIMDVTGHGLATALQTAAVNVLLHEAAELPLPIEGQLSWLNQRVSRYFDEAAFVAALAFEIDFGQKELRCAAAGITDFLLNNRHVVQPGLFLGVQSGEGFTTEIIPIAVGDTICFMTDGITDHLALNKLWNLVHARDVCRLFSEGELSFALHDDATAIAITVL